MSIKQMVEPTRAGFCRMSQIRFLAKTTEPAPMRVILAIEKRKKNEGRRKKRVHRRGGEEHRGGKEKGRS